MPKVSLKELSQLVEIEAPNHFPIELTQHSIDFKVIEEVVEDDITKYKVLILVTPLNILHSYVNVFEICGLHLEKIDLKGNSIAKLLKEYERVNALESKTNAVLDFGYDTTNITISNKGIIRYSRTLPYGSKQYNEAVMEILKCSGDEAEKIKQTYGIITSASLTDPIQNAAKAAWEQLANPLFEEVSRVCDFFASRQDMNAVDRLLLTGGGSQLHGIIGYMQNLFDMEIGQLYSEGVIDFTEEIELHNLFIYFSNCIGSVFSD